MPKPEEDAIILEQEQELHERYSALGYDDVISYYPPEMEAERDRFAIAITSVEASRPGWPPPGRSPTRTW